MNLTIPFIVLAIMFVAVVIGWSETWKKKEHYRCRVFDLTDGKEGSNLVKVVPDTPPPPAPQGLFPTRPLLTEWLHNNCGEYFRRKDVVALTKNPNRTMNVVLGNGYTINTGLELDDLKEVLGISFSCSVNEELAHRKKMYKKEEQA
jgi:hypothetical protein